MSRRLSDLEELDLVEWPDSLLEHQHFFLRSLTVKRREAGG